MSTRKSAAVSQMVEELRLLFPGTLTASGYQMSEAGYANVMTQYANLQKATRKLEIDLTAAKAEVSYWKQLYSTQQVKK